MTSRQPTITGELRKWQRDVARNVVIGKMYNDVNDIWEDGEDAVIHYKDWVESANFYLAVTNHSCVKCSKDEEKSNAVGNGEARKT